MNDIFSKISSYNLFNNLLPGIVFVALSELVTGYSFAQKDVLIAAFLYYFIGLVISRVGSLIIEPLLRKINFLNFADYKDFVSASKKDQKLEVLSEVNNTYRTLCSMFVLLFLLKLYEKIEQYLAPLQDWNTIILLTFLLIIFLLSYRKQSTYISKRINEKD